MSKLLLIIGAVFFIFGLVDFTGSHGQFDLWRKIGVQLPEVLWKYSAYIEMGVGAILFGAGRRYTDDEE